MSGDIWAVVFTVVLLGVNAYFVGVEFALISSRRDRLENMAAAGNRRAGQVIKATEDLTIMLAGAQFGITIASLLLGKVGEPAIAHLIEEPFHALGLPDDLLHPVGFAISLLLVTVLHIILGEMVPKNIALAGPESVATVLVGPHMLFCRIAHPIMVMLNWIARVTLHLVGVEQRDELDSTVSPSELAEMISESRSEGLIAPAEARRLSNALNSSKRTLHEVLIPRDRVRALSYGPRGLTVGQIEEAVSETGFSRFPVTDPAGSYMGYVHVKDVLDNVLDPATGPDQLLDVKDLRPLITVEGGANFDVAMKELRQTSSHMAQVSENGVIVGIVTLEDVIEELVGTVRDWTHDD
ncbi:MULTISPECIES: hemolysin family protein [Corynebacterium]|uniref:Magnesium and cobalt efflux protein CorC n=1 Tax=Corynebacterium provencense TaxID=1737425 RepID=A0A2Z3YQ45_9CORY|nr:MULTISPECIES: hemolysin family protein [Corynebacterium]AWT26269.1 Magnesium and cobalt efflux protein CorC [Corynebacterium provencense]MCI1256970.1 hemolysin family protein [Corynebacterium provencense]